MKSTTHFVAIDIGSNAVRMALARVKGSQLKVLNSWREYLRLGDDVFHLGIISNPSLQSLHQTLSSFIEKSQNYPNSKLTVVATSAMRDAENRLEIINYIHDQLGLSINILSGNQEAAYTGEVIQNYISWGDKLVVLGDLGGGSLEVSSMQGQQLLFRKSFDYGVLRFSELTLLSQKNYLKSLEKEFNQVISLDKQVSQLILTGGTAKVLAKLIAKYYDNQPPKSVMEVSWNSFLDVKESILKTDPQAYVKDNVLRPDQANVLFPSLLVYEMLGSHIQCQKITIPFVGLKEGVLLHTAQQSFPNRHLKLIL